MGMLAGLIDHVVGVDTHRDAHAAAVCDPTGGVLAESQVAADAFGGDRQLNRALHTIVLSRLAHHPETRAYAARRAGEGRTPREIRRCLKRFVARRLFHLLEASQQAPGISSPEPQPESLVAGADPPDIRSASVILRSVIERLAGSALPAEASASGT